MREINVKGLLDFLQEKWGDSKQCPLCGGPNWSIEDKAFQLVGYEPPFDFSGSYSQRDQPLIPLVPVTCTNCGNTVLINAIRAGVVSQDGTINPETSK